MQRAKLSIVFRVATSKHQNTLHVQKFSIIYCNIITLGMLRLSTPPTQYYCSMCAHCKCLYKNNNKKTSEQKTTRRQ